DLGWGYRINPAGRGSVADECGVTVRLFAACVPSRLTTRSRSCSPLTGIPKSGNMASKDAVDYSVRPFQVTSFGTVMQIAQTRAEMLVVVEALRQQLGDRSNAKAAAARSARARREVERIRKGFEWRIDKRARYKAGEKWFSINCREGIERELA